MKKMITLMLCMMFAFTISAQEKKTWSVKAGLGMSSWMGKDKSNTQVLFSQKYGVNIDIPLNWLVSFQTGIFWEEKGTKVDASYEIGDIKTSDVYFHQHYFQMPILAAFHLGTGKDFDVVLTAGPYLAMGVKGKTEVDVDDFTISKETFEDAKIDDHIEKGLHKFDAGLQLGAALDFGKWVAGIDGEFGFLKLNDYKIRNMAFFVTAAYKF